jgi:hypothetical protein
MNMRLFDRVMVVLVRKGVRMRDGSQHGAGRDGVHYG